MAVKLKGLQSTISTLSELNRRSTELARQEVVKGAEAIEQRAKMYAPVDLHNLEKAIRMTRPVDANSQYKTTVEVGGIVGGRDVSEYAMIMHEWSGGWGKGTLAKAAALGVQVGPKYLERASRELFPQIQKKISASLNAFYSSKGLVSK